MLHHQHCASKPHVLPVETPCAATSPLLKSYNRRRSLLLITGGDHIFHKLGDLYSLLHQPPHYLGRNLAGKCCFTVQIVIFIMWRTLRVKTPGNNILDHFFLVWELLDPFDQNQLYQNLVNNPFKSQPISLTLHSYQSAQQMSKPKLTDLLSLTGLNDIRTHI